MVIIQAIINRMHYSISQVKLQEIKEKAVRNTGKKSQKNKGKAGENRRFWQKKVCRLTKRHTLTFL